MTAEGARSGHPDSPEAAVATSDRNQVAHPAQVGQYQPFMCVHESGTDETSVRNIGVDIRAKSVNFVRIK